MACSCLTVLRRRGVVLALLTRWLSGEPRSGGQLPDYDALAAFLPHQSAVLTWPFLCLAVGAASETPPTPPRARAALLFRHHTR